MLGRAETAACAASAYQAARAAADTRKALTGSEAALLQALGDAVGGHTRRAANRLEAHIQDHPEEFLCGKIAHALRFMLGDATGMLRLTSNVVRRSVESGAGYGFMLGCHAFGLEECGAYAEAEAVGRRAVTLEPADSWGLHAVSHVFEMNGRVSEGVEWLGASRPVWSQCNNFSFHMAWHLALLHLEAGDEHAVLAVYDEQIRPVQTDDFRDMANAVSMLWRLEQDGVDVGPRWQGLHDIAHRRRADTTYVFASLHYLLVLLASNDRDAADDLVAALRLRAMDGSGDQARAAAQIGLPIAQAIMRWPQRQTKAEPDLRALAKRLPGIGGSNAQRDVFLRSLIVLAAECRDQGAFRMIAALRRELRQEDRFDRDLNARIRRAAPLAALT
jgi:hypothetical protein